MKWKSNFRGAFSARMARVRLWEKRDYVPLTHLERWVPVAFAALYFILIAYTLLVPATSKG